MKKLLFLLIIVCVSGITNAQPSVHQTAYFNSTTSHPCLVTNYMEGYLGFANDRNRTFEAWVKRDTIDAAAHTIIYAPNWVFGSPVPILYMYLQSDSVYAFYGSFKTGGHYPADTNWHHISFIVQLIHDTTWFGGTPISITNYDSNVVYVDGVVSGNRTGNHDAAGSGAGTSIYIGCYWTTSGLTDFWDGHISRIAFYDTVLHASSFTPDCVFDTTMFYSGGNISLPCIVLAPLNGNNNSYYEGITPVPISPSYTYETSPCAPTYTFYCPATDTIHYTGTDTVLKAVNTNASYMKGSHSALHKNGWLDPSTVTADYTSGIFTDTLLTAAAGIYPYVSSYKADTEKVVVVVHDTTSNTSVAELYKVHSNAYPNPLQNTLTIETPARSGALRIINLQGREVFKTQIQTSVLQLDLSDLKHGLYIIEENGVFMDKILKE